jgi:23S rRNA (guanosine2251-2'-O)-methyltransferase
MKPENQERWALWQRNVRDCYKDVPTEEVKKDLQAKALPMVVLIANVEGDFNLASIIRSANNFNLSAVYYYGKKKFDKRAALGTHHYTKVVHLSLEEVDLMRQLRWFIGLENNVDKPVKDLRLFKWPERACLVVGEENAGIPSELLERCDYLVEIPSMGSVRSLNAASAASIAMYDYVSKLNGE